LSLVSKNVSLVNRRVVLLNQSVLFADLLVEKKGILKRY
jgi:hypothetical protein